MKTFDEILDAALQLPCEDRLRLADTLLAELTPDEGLIAPEDWRAELARRSKDLHDGVVQAVPWDEVRRRLKERRRKYA